MVDSKSKKKGFFKRHREKMKKGGIISISLAGTGVILGGVVAHIVNPALGFVTVPLFLQALITLLIKKAPETINDLKDAVKKTLKDEDEDKISNFVDDVLSQFSANTARSREPLPTPSEDETPIQMNAYYYEKKDKYVVTPESYQRKKIIFIYYYMIRVCDECKKLYPLFGKDDQGRNFNYYCMHEYNKIKEL